MMATVLSNGQVVAFLQTLPKDDSFGTVRENDKSTRKILNIIFTCLRKVFQNPSSSHWNAERIASLEKLEISQRHRFPDYKEHAADFWESQSLVIRYLMEKKEERAAAFLTSVYQLNQTIEQQNILQRFAAVASYKLYQRAFRNVRVLEVNVEKMLRITNILDEAEVEDENTQNEVQKKIISEYSEIIRRGQRAREFCITFAQKPPLHGDDCNLAEEKNDIYGPLFIDGIPDEIWKRGGLIKGDYNKAIEGLRKLWNNADGAITADATEIAEFLLDFHAESVLWFGKSKSKRRPGWSYGGTQQRKKGRTGTAHSSSSRPDALGASISGLENVQQADSTQQDPNESEESRPHRTNTASSTIEDEVTATSTHDSSAETQTDPFSAVQVSLAETEESPDPSVSTAGDAVSIHESTSEVDGSSDTTSSGVTSLTDDSTSGETQNHWISGTGLRCNLQFKTVNCEPSTEQAASLLFGFRNPQPAPSFPPHRVSNATNPGQFQPSAGGLINEAAYLPDPAATIGEDPSSQWQTQQFSGRTVQEETQSYVPSGLQPASRRLGEIQHGEINDEPTGDDQSSMSGSVSMPTWTYQNYPNEFTMHEINMFPLLPPRQDLSQDILNEINMFPPLPPRQDLSQDISNEINMFPPLPPQQDFSQYAINEINMFPPLPLQRDPSVTCQGQY